MEDDPEFIMKGMNKQQFQETIKLLVNQCHFMIKHIDEEIGG